MKKRYSITIEKGQDGMFVAEVQGLPACYTQAKTIPELLARLVEVTEGSFAIHTLGTTGQEQHLKLSLHVDYASSGPHKS